MITLSLCMIIKDEELVLDRCLKSIYDAVDEIIIVDTGSTDNSKNICKNYTENIYDYIWNDDFSAARNFSFEKVFDDCVTDSVFSTFFSGCSGSCIYETKFSVGTFCSISCC